MSLKQNKINPDAIAWLETFSEELDADPDIIDVMPIENVREELRRMGAEVKNFMAWAEKQRDDSELENILKQLKGWFQGIFSGEWQPAKLVPAYRGARNKSEAVRGNKPFAKQAKIFQIEGYEIAVCVSLMPLEKEEVDVCMEIYPAGQTKNLPPDMKVFVTDQTDDIFMSTESGKEDIFLRLTWIREAGDRYRVRIVWDQIEIEEKLTD